MRSFHCEVTTRCNLACPYCYVVRRDGEGLSASDWSSLIRYLGASAETMFVITGGEPLLLSGICDVLRSAQESGISHLYTNAAVDRDSFDKALRFVDMIRISVDGSNPSQYGMTRNKDLFPTVVRNIRHVTTLGIPHSVQITISQKNVGFVPDTVGLLVGLGVERIVLSPVLSPMRNPTDWADLEAMSAVIRGFFDLCPQIVRQLPVGPQRQDRLGPAGNACGVFLRRFLVTSDGYLAGCPLLSGKSNQIGCIAGATKERIDLVISQAQEYASAESRGSRCRVCAKLHDCGGWCPGVRRGIKQGCPCFSTADGVRIQQERES